MPTIEELNIEIQSSSEKATSGIDQLTASLTRLKSAVKGGAGLTTTTKQLQAFGSAVSGLKDPGNKIQNLAMNFHNF